MNSTPVRMSSCFLVLLVVIVGMPLCQSLTDQNDVFAINNLYAALGSPTLPGWIASGGDPCGENWQGVQCVESHITGIVLNAANLGGQLGHNLDSFNSIITIDLSNNHIGGSIPDNLPTTLQRLFLSANNFTGSLPKSLAGLTFLAAMSLNENHLSGELPDAFQSLAGLINLDLSSNNISGQLPQSMGNMSSLTTLNLQNNQLSGTLIVLQDLPLQTLNIENNLFSGPIPPNILSIPNFKKDGNPFNTTNPTASPPSSQPPSSPPSPVVPHTSGGPSAPLVKPANSSDGPAALASTPSTKSSKKRFSALKIVGCVIAAVILVIILLLLMVFCISKWQERKSKDEFFIKKREERVYDGLTESPRTDQFVNKPNDEARRGALQQKKEEGIKTLEAPKENSDKEKKERKIELGQTNVTAIPLPGERVIVKPKIFRDEIEGSSLHENQSPRIEEATVHPVMPTENIARVARPESINPPTSVASFSVASLQQYTNSFSEENVIRDGRFGKVYLAELPDGQSLAVMKLDGYNSKVPVHEFLELVLSISELRHPNIVELVGYCAEFDLRLLVYKYHSMKSLNDILHYGDDLRRKLSWNSRLHVALDAAKALEYLHEGCDPPIIHQNFESANVLLDDKFSVLVFECGLAAMKSSNSVSQLSGRMQALYSYEAPEINESGTYSDRSDVYSFGVVMLELLTGRKPYDSTLPRQEQHLVRWASSQLYDINALSRMVDPAIGGKCPEKLLSQFADIISRSIQQGPEFRPPMSEVVQDLTRMVEESGRMNDGSREVR